ncbi:MAG: response regulator transcription factor [Candidatus Binatia bacterium]
MKRILIVEDELSISNLISYNLQQAGYQVAPAYDGPEAVRLIDDFCPHLITLDLLLPLQSGWQVLDAVRRHPRKQVTTIPVIVLSALSSPKLQNELLLNGVVHCLGKPFSVTELCMLINSLLSESGDPAWSSPV